MSPTAPRTSRAHRTGGDPSRSCSWHSVRSLSPDGRGAVRHGTTVERQALLRTDDLGVHAGRHSDQTTAGRGTCQSCRRQQRRLSVAERIVPRIGENTDRDCPGGGESGNCTRIGGTGPPCAADIVLGSGLAVGGADGGPGIIDELGAQPGPSYSGPPSAGTRRLSPSPGRSRIPGGVGVVTIYECSNFTRGPGFSRQVLFNQVQLDSLGSVLRWLLYRVDAVAVQLDSIQGWEAAQTLEDSVELQRIADRLSRGDYQLKITDKSGPSLGIYFVIQSRRASGRHRLPPRSRRGRHLLVSHFLRGLS